MAALRIFVIAEPSGNNTPGQRVSYTLTQDLDDNDQRTKRGKKIKIEEKEQFDMKLTLCDSTGLGLRYAAEDDRYAGADKDSVGPFWVHNKSGCPTSRGDRNNFVVERKNDRRIVVTNKNRDKADYQFKLRIFAGGDDESFDPVISNGGGGNKFNWAIAVVVAVAVAGAATVAYFAGLFGQMG